MLAIAAGQPQRCWRCPRSCFALDLDLDAPLNHAGPRSNAFSPGHSFFGEGAGTTLEMVYNKELDRTYLTDAEADAQGHNWRLHTEWILEIEA